MRGREIESDREIDREREYRELLTVGGMWTDAEKQE